MPRPFFAYVPDVLPGGTNIPKDSEAGDWFHSLSDTQLTDYLRQLDKMLDSFDSSYLTIFAVENPLAALERCRGNLNCLVFANSSAIVLVNNPKLVAAILRLFRVEMYLLHLCARTPFLQGHQPSSRYCARLMLEGRLDFAYLLLHHPEFRVLAHDPFILPD
ncbi:hypothetical protein HYPSUDRAFT_199387 [Hypholoma sublateritium FD-334 SS-4]|uniref:Uncharacterized protein n=1 Tax=Hypholoma sublateritium (strain FD-334 SS-4) TaxID=945553 RepID=A0A0D2PAQ4_HYPSF|nr:hypothetical protein HYPSUDRAFT_199387 [Hypholoma sublateritium FD-334 SS-4]